MSLKKLMKGVPSEILPAEGLLSRDKSAITPCQAVCADRLGKTLQLEQEHYLLQHPEIKTMLAIFISKMVQMNKMKEVLKEASQHFTRPINELDEEIRQKLNLLPDERYDSKCQGIHYNDTELKDDLRKLITKHYPPEPPKIQTPSLSTIFTESSSFLSILTSNTTLATPEPIPTPEPTFSETMFKLVSNTVDKAIYLRVDDQALNYDTAYIELSKAVEAAMEIPVIEIKKDIAEMYYKAYELFQFNIDEKQRIAAEIAWEKRMRKKLKRTLRRMDNFKGYETPPTPKSEISSHESYKIAPPRPCVCHPHYNYNRYPKDRFGIYLPREQKYSDRNVTVTPAISEASDENEHEKE
ncbi:uncharacterized protein LOC116777760 [Danaus plexippus]|nr:uncharacterized protein LOC116777760 [Danaus plexippus]